TEPGPTTSPAPPETGTPPIFSVVKSPSPPVMATALAACVAMVPSANAVRAAAAVAAMNTASPTVVDPSAVRPSAAVVAPFNTVYTAVLTALSHDAGMTVTVSTKVIDATMLPS